MEYKLSEIFELQMGKTPDRHNADYWMGGTKQWISIADIGKCDKYIEETAECITDRGAYESGIKIIPQNTVIMSFKLSIGKVAITSKSMYSNEAIMAFIDKNIIEISPVYLFYLLKEKDWTESTNKAVMGKTLNKAILSQIKINIHTIDEQMKIVERLDKLSYIITLRKKQICELDKFIRARFVEMFGDPVTNPKEWQIVTVRDVATEVRYGTSKPAVAGGKYPYLRMNNLTYDGHLDLADLKYINIPDDEIEKCVVRKGDVLFNRTNSIELVGKTTTFDLSEDMVIAGYIIRVRLNEFLLPEVLSQYMNLEPLKDLLRGIAKGAVNQANINAQELQDIKIYLPDMELQDRFVSFKKQVGKSKAVVQKALDEAQLLFDSLMQEYFG